MTFASSASRWHSFTRNRWARQVTFSICLGDTSPMTKSPAGAIGPAMTRLLLVALGGAIGSSARYGLGLAALRLAPNAAWPWGTFAANVAGGLLMGLLAGWLALKGGAEAETIRLFAAVGVLGGFTTFSAFSLEAVQMIERRQWALASGYVAASTVLAIAAVFLGLMIARRAFS